jgi:hypothetical protein
LPASATAHASEGKIYRCVRGFARCGSPRHETIDGQSDNEESSVRLNKLQTVFIEHAEKYGQERALASLTAAAQRRADELRPHYYSRATSLFRWVDTQAALIGASQEVRRSKRGAY